MSPSLPPTRTRTSLTVAEELPPLERTIDLVSMVAYAGATWDWHRMHYDREYVDAKGFAAPVVDGQVFGALIAEHLQDSLGPLARIATLSFKFRSMVFAGATVTVQASCAAINDDAVGFNVEVRAVGDSDGAESRVAVTGAALVELPE